jgi:hypothetical protein
MSKLHEMPRRDSKRGIAVYAMRRHAEQATGATPEAICGEIFATGRFRDYREVAEFYNWAIRDEWVKGLKEHPALARRPPAPTDPTLPSGAISIRDPEVGELARELARLRKTNMTQAIGHALRSELKRERDKRPLREQLKELAERARAMAGPNPREVTKQDIDAMWGQ